MNRKNGFTLSLSGVPEVKRTFMRVAEQGTKASRDFATKVGRVARKEIKQEIKKNDTILTKALYDSIEFKVPNLRKTGSYIAVAGPSKDFQRPVRMRKSGKHAGKMLIAKPMAIAHLVEDGTVQRKTKKGENRGVMPKFQQTAHARNTIKQIYVSVALRVFKSWISNGSI